MRGVAAAAEGRVLHTTDGVRQSTAREPVQRPEYSEGGAEGGSKVAAQNWKASSPGCSGLKLRRVGEELAYVKACCASPAGLPGIQHGEVEAKERGLRCLLCLHVSRPQPTTLAQGIKPTGARQMWHCVET